MIKREVVYFGPRIGGNLSGVGAAGPGFIDPRKRGLLYSVRRWTREEVIPH